MQLERALLFGCLLLRRCTPHAASVSEIACRSCDASCTLLYVSAWDTAREFKGNNHFFSDSLVFAAKDPGKCESTSRREPQGGFVLFIAPLSLWARSWDVFFFGDVPRKIIQIAGAVLLCVDRMMDTFGQAWTGAQARMNHGS